MNRIQLFGLWGGLVLLCSSISAAQTGGLQYSVTDLGSFLKGSSISSSVAYGINENSQVVGTYLDGKDQLCFLYTPGRGAVSFSYSTNTPQWCDARGINIWGDVAGTTDLGTKNAFLLESNGTFHYYGAALGLGAFGFAVNDRKNLVGASDTIAGVWDLNGIWTSLDPSNWGGDAGTGASPGGAYISLYRVLDCVLYDTASGKCVDFPHVCSPWDPLFSDDFDSSQGVNDSGVLVGFEHCTVDGDHAMLWANTITYNLGATPSRAYAISNENWLEAWIVGWTGYWGDSDHAFLANLGCPAFVEINKLLDPMNRRWRVTQAFGINRSHFIVGQAINPSGQPRAVLLTPNGLPLC